MSLALTLVIAALTGAVSLSYEIVWFRVYSFASGGSPAAFGLLLGYYLAGLAIGAYLSRALCHDRSTGEIRLEKWVLLMIVLLANIVGYLVVPTLAWLITRLSWMPLLLLISIAASLFGATLPLVSHLGIEPDDRAGARLSYLYLANVLGAATGSLITGFVLMNMFSLRAIALDLVLIGFALCIALVPLLRLRRRVAVLGVAALGAAGVAAISVNPWLFDRLYEKLLFKDHYAGDRFADLVENREGVIAVTRTRRVYGGGAYDGVISTDLVDDRNIVVRAYGATAIHPHPRHVLMIGLSTGAWAQIIASSSDVEHLTVIEINPGYLQLIGKYPQVASLLSNPKVDIVIDDGRRWLVRHADRKFDLIVQNTTEHWRAHTTNLLSREYLTLVRAHLLTGGVFHYNTTDSQDAFKTAFTLFPHGLRFVNFATVSDSPVALDRARWRAVLLGYRIDGRAVLDTARERDRSRLDSLLAFAKTIDSAPTFFGLESRDHMMAHLADASVITDDNMLPEWRRIVIPR